MMFTRAAIIQLVGLASIADARLFDRDREGGRFFFGGGGSTMMEQLLPTYNWSLMASALSKMHFNRISHFLVCSQFDPKCNVDNETSSEIVVASKDGNMLYYSDSPLGVLGIVNITDPFNPQPAGTVDMGGEPTSTATVNDWILAAVNTSPNFTNPSGNLQVIDPETLEVVRTFDLGGQPDCVAVSPDQTFVAIAIENERDEEFEDGVIPQLPAGYLSVIDTSSADPADWVLSTVNLTGLDGVEVAPSDPEPEFVSINSQNIAAVTLQENNAIVMVELATLSILSSFSCGTVDLESIDCVEDLVISQTCSLDAVPREPDGIAWIGDTYVATADEGDYNGGTRGFTIFNAETGAVVYTAGNEVETVATKYGHYPEARSESKGNEPESVLYAEFGDMKYLFLLSERSSLVFVYDVADVENPTLMQVLPAGASPEGIYAIPERNLLVVASEMDERDTHIRSSITIYELQNASPDYPTVVSAETEAGTPIPFSALSGLAANGTTLYSVEDSFYKSSRMFVIDTNTYPYLVTAGVNIVDTSDILLDLVLSLNATIPGIASMVNDDKTVNLDLEGIDIADNGTFWLCSEGGGSVGDEEDPVSSLNMLFHVTSTGEIVEVVLLPDELNAVQVSNGFEGVAVVGSNTVVAALQREWTNETNPRIGVYNTEDKTWQFAFYPLDAPESQYGGWVGISDIEHLSEGQFLILERDNQAGPDAAIKRIYYVDMGDLSAVDGVVLEKTLVTDLMPKMAASGGMVIEKVEGMAVDGNGDIWINTDNDGVDDNRGENQFLKIGAAVLPSQ